MDYLKHKLLREVAIHNDAEFCPFCEAHYKEPKRNKNCKLCDGSGIAPMNEHKLATLCKRWALANDFSFKESERAIEIIGIREQVTNCKVIFEEHLEDFSPKRVFKATEWAWIEIKRNRRGN